MDARVIGEFGGEGGGHGSSLADGYRVGAFGGNNFHAFSDVLNLGGADENHFHGRGAELVLDKSAFADGTVDLASVGVAADADVERAEAFLLGILHFSCQEDCAGACAEGGLGFYEVLQLCETLFAQEL